MKDWFKRLRIRSLHQQNTNWGMWALFVGSFADASFIPLPAQTFFLLLMLMNSTKFIKYVILGTLGTFAGALAGYLIGHFAFVNVHGDSSGFMQFLFDHIPGFSEDACNRIQFLYSKWNFWILFIASFTPIPYGLFSISSGVFEINLLIFCLATLISQVLKFFLLAFVTMKLGPKVKKIFEYHLTPYAILALAGVIIIILVI